jgi:hypothetical protein
MALNFSTAALEMEESGIMFQNSQGKRLAIASYSQMCRINTLLEVQDDKNFIFHTCFHRKLLENGSKGVIIKKTLLLHTKETQCNRKNESPQGRIMQLAKKQSRAEQKAQHKCL